MKMLFAVVAFALCAEVAAQEMYKCKNAAGRITYSGSPCKDLGLTSAGEVKGQANVIEAPAGQGSTIQRETTTPTPKPRPAVKQEAPAESPVPAAEVSSGTPERRCFTVKTAKGTTTRCNDKPPEEE